MPGYSTKNQNGGALLITFMVSLLVTGLLLLTLNIGGMEHRIAVSNNQNTQNFQAASGGAEIAHQILLDTLDLAAIPGAAQGYPVNTPSDPQGNTVVFDSRKTAGIASVDDFVEELRVVNDPDTVTTSPDVTITALANQTISVDIDLEAPAVVCPGCGLESFDSPQTDGSGTRCNIGDLYFFDVVSNSINNTQAQVRSAYLKCP